MIAILPFTEKINVFFNFHLISKDEDDNKYVDCAVASNAVCLVSNDRHFQEVKKVTFPQVNILTLMEFEDQYKPVLIKNN